MRGRGTATAGVLVLAGLALTGCGEESVTAGIGDEDRVPITERAIAAIALDHVDLEPTHLQSTSMVPEGVLGADLRFHGDGEDDGDLLLVRLGPELPNDDDGTCAEIEHCAMLDSGQEGVMLRLSWGLEEPEEDPGGYSVTRVDDGRGAYAAYSGEPITGDPREIDLEIPVEVLVALLDDPALDLRTTPEAVEAGEQLDDWNQLP